MNRAAAKTEKAERKKETVHNNIFHLYHWINLTVDSRAVEMVVGDFAADDLDRLKCLKK
jgi:hypothetical protein